MNIISIVPHVRFPNKSYQQIGYLIRFNRNPIPDFTDDFLEWYSIPHNKVMFDEWDKSECCNDIKNLFDQHREKIELQNTFAGKV